MSGDDAPEMVFVQNDDVIEAVAAHGSDQPFDERVVPRTSRCAEDLLDAHASHPALNFPAVDRLAIAKEVFRGAVPWKGFDDPLARPLRGWILRDVEMSHLSSSMCEYDQHVE